MTKGEHLQDGNETGYVLWVGDSGTGDLQWEQ